MARRVVPLYRPRYVPSGNEVAVFDTVKGVIKVELLGKDAPITVGNFVELACKGFYDKLNFYNKVPGDVVVGGCPITRPLSPHYVRMAVREQLRGVHPGMGDSGYRIEDEWTRNPNNHHSLGTLSLTHKKVENSGSCQFFFCLADHPEYDDGFTAFGRVIEGLDVVERLGIGDLINSVVIEGAHELPTDDDDILAADDAQQSDAETACQEALADAEAASEEPLSAEERQAIIDEVRAGIVDKDVESQAASIRGLNKILGKKAAL